MKKLLLLFASMFFMFGTSFAQDKGDGKDEGNAAFALEYSYPKDGESVFTVYNIRLKFNKDVVATLPEGGIDVKNNTTNEVVKITRLDDNQWLEKSEVVFLFEQKSVYDEKEGKEELKDQVIETPGQWSYTIPAGCIKSVEDEEFAEQTFTFNIASAMDIVSVAPANEVTKLDKIEVTFPKAIASVNTSKLSLLDNNWMPAGNFKEEVTYSEDRKTVTLELQEPITTPGTYNLDIYQGVFLSEDGALNNYQSVSFRVIDPTPSFATNYKEGEVVEEIVNLEITFKNVNEVKPVEDAKPVSLYLPNNSIQKGTAIYSDNKIYVTFGKNFTDDGKYTFVIPAGMFTMDGKENEEHIINVTVQKFQIIPLEVLSITPAAGSDVNQIDKIIIEFNQNVSLSYNEDWQQISGEIVLKGEDKDYTLTYNPSQNLGNKIEYITNAVWTGHEYTATPITAAGEYTLDLSQIVVDHAAENYIDENGYPNTKWHSKNQVCKGEVEWTIVTPEAGIEELGAENGAKAIFDITGRRVEKITDAGIYIVGGKKVLVK